MTPLPQILLGDSLRVSPLGFGGMVLASTYAPVEPDAALATLHHALDVGVTFLDTANVYGAGSNEELIGRLLATRRAEVVLATKFGIAGDPRTGSTAVRGDAAYVRACAEDSLRRLNTDVIDLFYLHRRDVHVPLEETVGAMAELVTDGKVRHLGLSEVTATELRTAYAVHPIAAVQSEWSIWSRDIETHVVPAAAELGVGLVPYSPLGRGFLTGTVRELGPDDIRHHFPRFAAGAFDANAAVVDVVQDVARQLTASTGAPVTPAQVALAWLLARGRELHVPVVPIPGTRRAERIDENLGALPLRFTPEQMIQLAHAADHVQGARSRDPHWVSQGRE